jgi:hypothetical protein
MDAAAYVRVSPGSRHAEFTQYPVFVLKIVCTVEGNFTMRWGGGVVGLWGIENPYAWTESLCDTGSITPWPPVQ